MRNRFLSSILVGAVVLFCGLGFTSQADAQRRRAVLGKICGDPSMRCGESFEPHDLQFRLPRNAVIYETEPFYAVILQSQSAKADCAAHIPEEARLEAQRLFPKNKVFADRCPEPGNLSYSNTNSDHRFMAVYAGKTRAEAERMLKVVRATGKYSTANVRRMVVSYNGT